MFDAVLCVPIYIVFLIVWYPGRAIAGYLDYLEQSRSGKSPNTVDS